VARLKGVSESIPNESDEVKQTGVSDDDRPGWQKKIDDLKFKFKLGQHHKMERFMLLGAMSVALLFTGVIGSGVSHYRLQSEIQSTQRLYNEVFTFSLSQEKAELLEVYRNPDQTKAVVLFKLQNPQNVSLDVNNYEFFLTRYSDKSSYEPTVNFGLFGSTGYGFFEVSHDEPFPNEVIDVTVRSLANVTGQAYAGGSSDEIEDASFSEYDQAKFYFNPGVDEIPVVEELDGDMGGPELYRAFVAREAEADIKEKIKENTDQLSSLLTRATEYENRIRSAGYAPPKAPWFVEGDYINEEGHFVSNKDVHRSYPIDYANRTIDEGYLNQVIDNLSELTTYLASVRTPSPEEREKELAFEEKVLRVDTLTHENGDTLMVSEVRAGSSPASHVDVVDSLKVLESTWSEYLAVKRQLQIQRMEELLILDADVQSQAVNFSYGISNDEQVWHY